MIFKDNEHKEFFDQLSLRYKDDKERLSLFYCLGVLESTRLHVPEIYDLDDEDIIMDCLRAYWMDAKSLRMTLLGFNLYNNFVWFENPKFGTPLEVFRYRELRPFVISALRFRYENNEPPEPISLQDIVTW